jgi:hypothetical protein
MGLLNQASDGLPSVLFALIRAVRQWGTIERDDLLALCCPPTLQWHTPGFERSRHGPATLLRWTQLGLFRDQDGKISLDETAKGFPSDGLAEVRAFAPLLRALALKPDNNRQLNVDGGELAADLTLALCWVLAQDILCLPGGAYKNIEPLELRQFGTSQPYAFRNDTRWNGFRAWAPLLGFAWTEAVAGNQVLVVDPTPVVRDALPSAFENASELPIDDLLGRLARAIPVLDGGEYRTQVEARLAQPNWRATRPHEVSVSLSTALKRLDTAGVIRLQSRADAPRRMLLGHGHRDLEQVSHVAKGNLDHA